MSQSIGILANLPPELGYLAAPAMTYGVNQLDDEVDDFLRRATEEQMEELAMVAERIRLNKHLEAINEFMDRFPITEHHEAANLYFLLGLMDAAELRFEAEDWDTVESHIQSLIKFGSFRLASNRMHAACFLAEFGEEAKPAIPYLRDALEDEDERVRVWAHFALAVIEGNHQMHEQAVRKILAEHDGLDELGLYDEIGSEAEAALEKFRRLPASR